ncbi:hypothetical protein thsps117_17110 [Pseudomonas sp. No.117]
MTEIRVVKSEVGGDVIGGSKYEVHISSVSTSPDVLRNAIERIVSMSVHDEELEDFLERYSYYTIQRSGRDVIGLEEKLRLGGREDLLEEAFEKKDRFAKKIMRTQLARRRQYVYFYALQKVQSAFDYQIKPLLKIGLDSVSVDAAIYKEVVCTIHSEVVQVDPSIDQHLISGMLFFLTGQCVLKWQV